MPTEIDPLDPQQPFSKSSDARHQFQFKRFDVHILETEDLHFNHDSSVLMPDYRQEPSNTFVGREGLTGLAVIRACLLFQKENPEYKLLIAGHTDTSGSDSYNLTLSRQRAQNIEAFLKGDRDTWRNNADQKGKTEDIQIILKWVARNWSWECDPGEVDNIMGNGTREAIKAFQTAYNLQFEGDLSVDGIMGPNTWGAVYDVMEEELREILEEDEEGLQGLRDQLNWLQNPVGCGEFHPIDQVGHDDYRSRTNRRVECLFFEPGEEPDMSCHPSDTACNPEKCRLYHPKIYRFHPIPADPVPAQVWIDLQTVDALGYRVPQVELELRIGEEDVEVITTDDEGTWSGRVRAGEEIEVWMADGRPTAFGASRGDEQPSGGNRETVVINPLVARRTVTDVVVPVDGQEEVEEERRQISNRYGRTPRQEEAGSIRSGETGEREGEEAMEISSRGGEQTEVSSRTYGRLVADNLYIAAGWDSNGAPRRSRLMELFDQWIRDRHPAAWVRNYFVSVLVGGRQVFLYHKNTPVSSDFNVSGPYPLKDGVGIGGRIGAHTTFEFFGTPGNLLFVDMNSCTTGLYPGSYQDGRLEPLENPSEEGNMNPDDPPEGGDEPVEEIEEPEVRPRQFSLQDLMEERVGNQYREKILPLLRAGRIEICYFLPTLGHS